MNKIQKAIVSLLVIAIMTFSAGAVLVHAAGVSSYSALPWASNELVTPGTLTIYGSSTVGPIASEEAATAQGDFIDYFNNLISTGVIDSSPITAVSIQQQGSGTAIPALAEATGSADIGEMSRPPSTGEYATAGMNNIQLYAVGLDSVAIVVDPTMTWFPTQLTTLQVAQLFADNNPLGTTGSQGTQGNTGSTPLYTTWGDFLAAYYGGAANIPSSVPSAVLTEDINRAVRDPTSGTFDCFNNYFAAPNGYTFEHKTSGIADASEEMAPFTYCQENSNVYNTVKAGNPTTGDYIGFISLGYLQTYGNMIGLNIAYNMASAPNGSTTSPIIAYYGTSGTVGFSDGVNAPQWGSYVKPTEGNVIWAYSGIQGSQATGQYEAWRWLWEVTPGTIPDSGPTLAAGVWIAYMMADGTTGAGMVATWNNGGIGTGSSSFVEDQNYIPLERDDMAGGQVLDSNLNAYNGFSASGYAQTSTFPTGNVNFNDITYFVGAYINYNLHGVYNPYADIDANGVINFNDILGFVGQYVYYYTGYNPA